MPFTKTYVEKRAYKLEASMKSIAIKVLVSNEWHMHPLHFNNVIVEFTNRLIALYDNQYRRLSSYEGGKK